MRTCSVSWVNPIMIDRHISARGNQHSPIYLNPLLGHTAWYSSNVATLATPSSVQYEAKLTKYSTVAEQGAGLRRQLTYQLAMPV